MKKWMEVRNGKTEGTVGFLKIVKIKSEIKRGYHYQFHRNLRFMKGWIHDPAVKSTDYS